MTPTDVLDCTYTNQARGTIIIEKITDDGLGAFNFTSTTSATATFTLTTTAAGAAGKDSETFADLAPGTYDVAETVPAGWNLVSVTCDDGSDPASIGLSARRDGDLHVPRRSRAWCHPDRQRPRSTRPQRAATIRTRASPSRSPVATLAAAGVTAVTDLDGLAVRRHLVVSSLVGNYTVTETVPAGYQVIGADTQSGIAVVAGRRARRQTRSTSRTCR